MADGRNYQTAKRKVRVPCIIPSLLSPPIRLLPGMAIGAY